MLRPSLGASVQRVGSSRCSRSRVAAPGRPPSDASRSSTRPFETGPWSGGGPCLAAATAARRPTVRGGSGWAAAHPRWSVAARGWAAAALQQSGRGRRGCGSAARQSAGGAAGSRQRPSSSPNRAAAAAGSGGGAAGAARSGSAAGAAGMAAASGARRAHRARSGRDLRQPRLQQPRLQGQRLGRPQRAGFGGAGRSGGQSLRQALKRTSLQEQGQQRQQRLRRQPRVKGQQKRPQREQGQHLRLPPRLLGHLPASHPLAQAAMAGPAHQAAWQLGRARACRLASGWRRRPRCRRCHRCSHCRRCNRCHRFHRCRRCRSHPCCLHRPASRPQQQQQGGPSRARRRRPLAPQASPRGRARWPRAGCPSARRCAAPLPGAATSAAGRPASRSSGRRCWTWLTGPTWRTSAARWGPGGTGS